jgi:hypothetical protein
VEVEDNDMVEGEGNVESDEVKSVGVEEHKVPHQGEETTHTITPMTDVQSSHQMGVDLTGRRPIHRWLSSGMV